MAKFLIRRITFLLISLFVVSVAVFAISELAPGNIAINTLGNTITPDQEASFNAQNGLDQPALTRYKRWMMGSDWESAQLIGDRVIRIYDENNDRYSWWAVDDDGILYQNYTPDGETIIRVERQPADGSTVEKIASGDVWTPNEDGLLTFWGVSNSGHAAMWIKGDDQVAWTLTKATWTSMAGAPRMYIPLQRGLLRGDPGVSFYTRRPVAETLIRRLKNTAILAGVAFIIVMPLALVLGLIAGLNEGGLFDRIASISSLVATATPEFASGVFLILIFSTWLDLVPGAVVVTSETAIFENPEMLILPVLTLTLIELGYVLRITRASMVEVMRTNYIRTAVLKGLPRRQVVFKHAIKNALMAPITIIMLHVNWLLGGIVIVETLFGFPGLGRYVLEAALFKDVYATEAAAMLLVVIAVGTQLFADIIYTYLNPRIRYG
ncbi:MAG: ABC transporter permease subunit [Anaerolineae bacterium]|nr:ABC transporter permease subunit [Anaerolineae bacterium]